MKITLHVFRNVGNYQSARRNIPEDLNPQQRRCENLKSRKIRFRYDTKFHE
jgi:hypothetical protein